jgi:lipid-binding SYLF domain-containing protein
MRPEVTGARESATHGGRALQHECVTLRTALYQDLMKKDTEMRTATRTSALIAIFMIGMPLIASAQSDEADRIKEAGVILGEIMAAPDKAIAVFPSTIKGAFIVGAQRGKGIISVRDRAKGTWSSPAFLTLTGGSVGFQIGGQAVDIVLVVQNRRGVENLLQNQFEIGGEASATAGPVGRDAAASTDIQLRAEILSYSRSRGLFAGVSLKGAAVRQDQDSNQKFYGSRFRTRDVVLDGKATMPQSPEAVSDWQAALGKAAR